MRGNQGVALSQRVCRVAAPTVVRRVVHPGGTHGIELDIALAQQSKGSKGQVFHSYIQGGMLQSQVGWIERTIQRLTITVRAAHPTICNRGKEFSQRIKRISNPSFNLAHVFSAVKAEEPIRIHKARQALSPSERPKG
jgi:hypothetical protein